MHAIAVPLSQYSRCLYYNTCVTNDSSGKHWTCRSGSAFVQPLITWVISGPAGGLLGSLSTCLFEVYPDVGPQFCADISLWSPSFVDFSYTYLENKIALFIFDYIVVYSTSSPN